MKKKNKEISKEEIPKKLIGENPLRIIQQSIFPIINSKGLLKEFGFKDEAEIFLSTDKKVKEILTKFLNEGDLIYEFLFILEQNILSIKCEKLYEYYKKQIYSIKEDTLREYNINLEFPLHHLKLEYPNFFNFIKDELNIKSYKSRLRDYIKMNKVGDIISISSKDNHNIKIEIDINKIGKDYRKGLLLMYIIIEKGQFREFEDNLDSYKAISGESVEKRKFKSNYKSRLTRFIKDILGLEYDIKLYHTDFDILKIR